VLNPYVHSSRISSSIFPKDLVEETTRTLGLLIPSIDKKSKTWFQQKQKELDLDPKAGTYGPLNASSRQIEHFNYWRDRLVILKQTFDDVEPHSLSLLVFDDRKKVQWYTFWIAALVLLLTIVFGLVQSVAGVVQAWAAVRSMPPVRTI
jgi:type II secretory pathway component PulL